MESAALGYVCAQQHIKYAEIRCTSNHVIPKNKGKWQLDGALTALGRSLDTILKDFFQ
jgi:nucleoside phosphorylase